MSGILWRCVRWPGHEAAHVTRRGDGWRRARGLAALPLLHALEPLEQTYARIAEDRYEYRSNSFVAELTVTADGFVKEYASVWVVEDVAR